MFRVEHERFFSRFDYNDVNAISTAPPSLSTAKLQERDRSTDFARPRSISLAVRSSIILISENIPVASIKPKTAAQLPASGNSPILMPLYSLPGAAGLRHVHAVDLFKRTKQFEWQHFVGTFDVSKKNSPGVQAADFLA
jgi:hypothetical protein